MNSREQALQRRVAYLEAQNTALMMVLDRAIQDIEVAESVACALVWDFEASSWEWVGDKQFCTYEHSLPGMRAADEIEESVIENWQRAVEATRGQRTATEIALEEANGIRRAADGSIISILPPEARK